MRIAITTLTAVVLLSLASQQIAWGESIKIGFVDLQQALNEVEEGKNAKAKLKKEFKEKQAVLDQEQEKLKQLKADLDQQELVMTEDAKRTKQQEFQKKFLELQNLYANLQKDLAKKEADLTGPIFERMRTIINKMGKADKYTFILEKNEAGILFGPAAQDLTSQLIRDYNAKKYK